MKKLALFALSFLVAVSSVNAATAKKTHRAKASHAKTHDAKMNSATETSPATTPAPKQ